MSMTATPPKPQTAPPADDNQPTDDAKEKAAKTSLSPIEWSVLVDQIKAGEDFRPSASGPAAVGQLGALGPADEPAEVS